MTTEKAVQNQTRCEFARIGPIWRNNSGVMMNDNGQPVRFGLGNENAQINKVIKSSDLIAITPVTITPDMVGQTLGVFTAFECKPSTWSMQAGDKRAMAQLKFHEIVRAEGGYAGFITDPQQISKIIKRDKT